MQQIKLTDWDQYYAENIADCFPLDNEAIFFKVRSGKTFKGQYTKGIGIESVDPNHDYNEEVIEWHPETVDL